MHFEISSLTRLQDTELCAIHTVLWVTAGAARCIVSRQTWHLSGHRLICIPPGTPFQLIPGEDCEGLAIRFTAGFLEATDDLADLRHHEDLYHLFAAVVTLTVRQGVEEEMQLIAARMIKENDNEFLYRGQILRRYLRIFLLLLSRLEHRGDLPPAQARNPQLVQKFMVMLEKDFKRMKSVNEYARELAVTPNHLNVLVKKHTRHPAGHHIRQRVALEAKRLAMYSDTCMKEIAWRLGFSDTAHFSKFFKKVTGMNFSEFRRRREPEALAG